MKKNLIPAFAAAVAMLSGVAQAHTHLKMSMPADKSVLAEPPAELMLHFSVATRLTALSIQKEGDSEATNLSAVPKEPSQALTVPLSRLAPGKYSVKWRAIGSDKHVMSGALQFTVTGK